MKTGLVGATAQERSVTFDAQRTINLYPVMDKGGKEVTALYGTPGLLLLTTIGTGPIRGLFHGANGRVFVISGSRLYEIDAAGNAMLRGSLDKNPGIISMEENGIQLGICDGTALYIFTYADNSLVKITHDVLPPVGTLTFLDGYFIASRVDSGEFYISSLYDGTHWAALDFASAESSPDDLLRVISGLGQLWLFGRITTEIWTNTGNSSFPFERINGGKMDVGIAAPHTAVCLDSAVFWVGCDERGTGIVYRAGGFTPVRVSTSPIEMMLQKVTDLSSLRAYSYQQDGHVFYILTGSDLETSLVLDLATMQWHERAYLNDQGQFEQHLGCCGVSAFGKYLVGDRLNGNIYILSQDVYDDNGREIASDRIFNHISDEGRLMRFNRLEIALEAGVGRATSPAVDPQIMMRLSKDGGKTWGDWHQTSMGRMGHYKNKVCFRRRGVSNQWTFHIRITSPVKRALIGGYLR